MRNVATPARSQGPRNIGAARANPSQAPIGPDGLGIGDVTGLGSSTLAETKLTIPMPPHELILRPRLHALLADSGRKKLTLVAAPAGFGKTALVTGWYASGLAPARVAWVSLDKSDDDRPRFWAYVLEALARIGVPITPALHDLVQRAQPGHPDLALGPLINSIEVLDQRFMLILDDCHVIKSPDLFEELDFLVRRLPSNLHVVILTRLDPPLSLARLRANGEMVEIRGKDLAFTSEEAEVFLEDHGLVLPEALRDDLQARIGGWPGALRLVTLSVADRDDGLRFIAELTGSDRTIADYLVGEVLDQLPPDVRRFLLWTSIATRLTGPLCDAITGEPGGAEMLRDLERQSFFVESLDKEERWYRYHQLFDECLRQELRREYSGMIAELNTRAAAWFAEQRLIGETIEHLLQAEDYEGVQRLLLREVLAVSARYDPRVVDGWLSVIPDPAVAGSPFLLMVKSLVDVSLGRVEEARQDIDAARKLLRPGKIHHELPEIRALVESTDLALDRLDCDLPGVRRHAKAVTQELARARAVDTPIGKVCAVTRDADVALVRFWHGNLGHAEQALVANDTLAEREGLDRMRLNSVSALALIAASSGRLRRAEELLATALDLGRRAGFIGGYQAMPAYLARGVVALERAEVARAGETLEFALEGAQRLHDLGSGLAATLMLARLAELDGRLREAFSRLEDAMHLWPGGNPPAALRGLMSELEALLCLRAGDLRSARGVQSAQDSLSGQSLPAVVLPHKLTAARVLLAQGNAHEAAAILGSAAKIADRAGLQVRAIEARVLQTTAAWAERDLSTSLGLLNQALALAEPETILRPFLEEAATIRPLLVKMELGFGDFALRSFRQHLLERMGVPADFATGHGTVRMVDALTEREVTVLRFLRGSLSNPDIASALAVSVNTVKTHIKHIYRKLGAQDRKQALTRAKEFDLL